MGQMDRALMRESRNILGADVEVSGRDPLSAGKNSQLVESLPDGGRVQQMISLVTMAAAPGSGKSRLVELRAVEDGYPFYGTLELSDQPERQGRKASLEKLGEDRLYVQQELLTQLDISVGDPIRLGRKDFTVAGGSLCAEFVPRIVKVNLSKEVKNLQLAAAPICRHVVACRTSLHASR